MSDSRTWSRSDQLVAQPLIIRQYALVSRTDRLAYLTVARAAVVEQLGADEWRVSLPWSDFERFLTASSRDDALATFITIYTESTLTETALAIRESRASDAYAAEFGVPVDGETPWFRRLGSGDDDPCLAPCPGLGMRCGLATTREHDQVVCPAHGQVGTAFGFTLGSA